MFKYASSLIVPEKLTLVFSDTHTLIRSFEIVVCESARDASEMLACLSLDESPWHTIDATPSNPSVNIQVPGPKIQHTITYDV